MQLMIKRQKIQELFILIIKLNLQSN